MSRIPGLEQRESLSAAYFADDYSIWPEPHRGADQARHVSAFCGVKLSEILCPALDFEGVLDNHVALVGIGPLNHLVDESTCQGCFAGARAAGNDDVAPLINRAPKTVSACSAENLV